MKVCPECQSQFDGSEAFCSNDGTKLVDAQPDEALAGQDLTARLHLDALELRDGLGERYAATLDGQTPLRITVFNQQSVAQQNQLSRFHEFRSNLPTNLPAQLAEVYAVDLNASPAYIAHQTPTGPSLRRVIDQRKAVKWESAVRVVCNVGRALDFLADHGFYYRDLHAQAIFVGDLGDGHIQLGEWAESVLTGVDRPLEVAEDDPGAFLGYPVYRAPESIRDAADTDRKSLVYALGMLLYDLIAGKPPFTSKSPADQLQRHLHEQPLKLSISRGAAGLPPTLDDILEMMWAKAPEQRFQTPMAAMGALCSLLDEDVDEIAPPLTPAESPVFDPDASSDDAPPQTSNSDTSNGDKSAGKANTLMGISTSNSDTTTDEKPAGKANTMMGIPTVATNADSPSASPDSADADQSAPTEPEDTPSIIIDDPELLDDTPPEDDPEDQVDETPKTTSSAADSDESDAPPSTTNQYGTTNPDEKGGPDADSSADNNASAAAAEGSTADPDTADPDAADPDAADPDAADPDAADPDTADPDADDPDTADQPSDAAAKNPAKTTMIMGSSTDGTGVLSDEPGSEDDTSTDPDSTSQDDQAADTAADTAAATDQDQSDQDQSDQDQSDQDQSDQDQSDQDQSDQDQSDQDQPDQDADADVPDDADESDDADQPDQDADADDADVPDESADADHDADDDDDADQTTGPVNTQGAAETSAGAVDFEDTQNDGGADFADTWFNADTDDPWDESDLLEPENRGDRLRRYLTAGLLGLLVLASISVYFVVQYYGTDDAKDAASESSASAAETPDSPEADSPASPEAPPAQVDKTRGNDTPDENTKQSPEQNAQNNPDKPADDESSNGQAGSDRAQPTPAGGSASSEPAGRQDSPPADKAASSNPPDKSAPSAESGPPRRSVADIKSAAHRAAGAGQPARAIELYLQAIDRNAADAAAHAKLGDLLFDQSKYSKALTHHQKAADIADDNAGYAIRLGRTLYRLGRYRAAQKAWQHAHNLAPNNPRVRKYLDLVGRKL